MNLAEIWRRLTTTRRARILEAELARERVANAEQGTEVARQGAEIIRLRAENRALLNSILGIAGVPPVSASLDDLAAVQSSVFSGTGTPACAPLLSRNPSDLGFLTESHSMNARGQAEACPTEDSPATRTANHSRPRANSTPHVAAPTRRRSWPQIHRLLEFESAQKEKPAADPLPPARH